MRTSIATMAGCIALLALPLSAQTLTEKEARKQLFSVKGHSVQIPKHSFIGADEEKLLRQIAQTQYYYGAVAVPPNEGLFSEAAFAAANFHSIPAAEKVALKNCEAKRKGGAPCTIVLRIFPKKWSQQPLMMSRDATEGFEKQYKRAKSPKAFAISPSTGAWASFEGEGGEVFSVARCNDKAKSNGAKDCVLVLRDN